MMRIIRSAIAIAIALTQLGAAAVAQDMQLPEPSGMGASPVVRIVLDGNTAFMHGDLRAAAKDYRTAIARKPDFAIAYFNLGLVEAHDGQRSRGLADMDRGIALADAHRMSATAIARLRALRTAFAAQSIST